MGDGEYLTTDFAGNEIIVCSVGNRDGVSVPVVREEPVFHHLDHPLTYNDTNDDDGDPC